ncbi:Crp/Fnr family transcriptional regulator [soil metagenome]
MADLLSDLLLSDVQLNDVLASVPANELEQLRPYMRRVSYARDEEIHAPGAMITDVHFPLSGMLSIIAYLQTGQSVEVGSVSSEGFTGAPFHRGVRNLPYRIAAQIAGEGIAIDAERFADVVERSEPVRQATQRYARALLTLMAQSTACNGAHGVEQRLAKWLLFSRDAARSDDLDLTQEYLATMIGVQRPTVTLAAGNLQQQGIISYRRGKIRILDVQRLIERSCECYETVRSEVRHLMAA